MTEEDFIKEYFSSKNIINESGEGALMFSFLADFLMTSNPVATMLLSYLGYEAARGAANFAGGIKGFADKESKSSKKSSIDNFLKDKVKSEKDILKLVYPIPNTIKAKRYPNRYLKYFLIIFTLQQFLSNRKIKITESNINDIYNNLQRNTYTAYFNDKDISLDETYIIIENSKIITPRQTDDKKGIDKDTFFNMIHYFFIEKPYLSEQLFILINNHLKKKIESSNLNYIFNLFNQNKPKYRIGDDKI
jgi:hypothetical protein